MRPLDDTPYTEWWRRLVAIVIDYAVIAVVLAVVLTGFDLATFEEQDDGAVRPRFTVVGVALTLVVPVVYLTVGTVRTGRTLGKVAMGCRVVRLDGRLLDVRGALLRSTLFALGVQICVLALVDGARALWDPQRQTWHDRLVGTVVVDG